MHVLYIFAFLGKVYVWLVKNKKTYFKYNHKWKSQQALTKLYALVCLKCNKQEISIVCESKYVRKYRTPKKLIRCVNGLITRL